MGGFGRVVGARFVLTRLGLGSGVCTPCRAEALEDEGGRERVPMEAAGRLAEEPSDPVGPLMGAAGASPKAFSRLVPTRARQGWGTSPSLGE